MKSYKLQIQVFGQLAELLGAAIIEVPFVESTGELKNWLENRYPGLAERKYMIALDKKIRNESAPIGEGAVLALLPPFSGG